MKFRKKPVTVEAVQLLWSTWSEMCDHIGEGFSNGFRGLSASEARALFPGQACAIKDGNIYAIVPTKNGYVLAYEGEWIVRGIEGELYPCADSIFRATHEPKVESTNERAVFTQEVELDWAAIPFKGALKNNDPKVVAAANRLSLAAAIYRAIEQWQRDRGLIESTPLPYGVQQ